MPPLDLRRRDHLAEDEPVDLDVARLGVEHRAAAPRTRRLIALTPSHGRAECAERPSKTTRALRLPRQPSCSVLSVGSRQITSCASSTSGARSKTRGQRVLGRAELLAREEEQREVVGELGAVGPAGELDHHREAALHVARAEADDRAVLDPAGQVALRRDGVGVAGEQHERLARPLGVEQRLAVRERRCSSGTASCDVGRRPRPRAATRTGCRRARASAGRAWSRGPSGIIDVDDSRFPGARARVRPRGAGSGCGRRRRARRGQGARPHGRRRAGRRRRAASRAPGAAHVRRQGQARGAEGALRASRAPRA